MKMEKLIQNLKNCDFIIDFDYGNTFCSVTKKSGVYLYEFVVGYDLKINNYIGATYENPEEAEIEIEIQQITGLCVYGFKNEMIEMSDLHHEKLTEIIEEKLIGKKFIK